MNVLFGRTCERKDLEENSITTNKPTPVTMVSMTDR